MGARAPGSIDSLYLRPNQSGTRRSSSVIAHSILSSLSITLSNLVAMRETPMRTATTAAPMVTEPNRIAFHTSTSVLLVGRARRTMLTYSQAARSSQSQSKLTSQKPDTPKASG